MLYAVQLDVTLLLPFRLQCSGVWCAVRWHAVALGVSVAISHTVYGAQTFIIIFFGFFFYWRRCNNKSATSIYSSLQQKTSFVRPLHFKQREENRLIYIKIYEDFITRNKTRRYRQDLPLPLQAIFLLQHNH